jgi:hypothetical protein
MRGRLPGVRGRSSEVPPTTIFGDTFANTDHPLRHLEAAQLYGSMSVIVRGREHAVPVPPLAALE